MKLLNTSPLLLSLTFLFASSVYAKECALIDKPCDMDKDWYACECNSGKQVRPIPSLLHNPQCPQLTTFVQLVCLRRSMNSRIPDHHPLDSKKLQNLSQNGNSSPELSPNELQERTSGNDMVWKVWWDCPVPADGGLQCVSTVGKRGPNMPWQEVGACAVDLVNDGS
jgi:hypothetical protein